MALYVDPADTGTSNIPREEFGWSLQGQIRVVDQGGMLVGQDKFPDYMATNALAVIAFDPTSRLQDQVHLLDVADLQIVPHALLGDGQMATLHACLDPEKSGTLAPLASQESSRATLDGAQVLTRMPVSTLPLDALDDVTSVDWLLLDSVNDNIAALNSSVDTMHRALLIHVCIPETPTHQHQAGLDDIQQWMSAHGFECHQINHRVQFSHLPNSNKQDDKKQQDKQAASLAVMEALFTPAAERLAHYDAERLTKLAFLLDTIYGVHDYSYTLLNRADPDAAKRYLMSRGYISSYDAEPDTFTLTAQYSPVPAPFAVANTTQQPDTHAATELGAKNADELFASGVAAQEDGQLPTAVAYYRAALNARLHNNVPTLEPAPKPAHDDAQDKRARELLMWDSLSRLARAGVHAFPMGDTLLGLSRDGDLPSRKSLCFGLPFCEHDSAHQCLEDNGWVVQAKGDIANPLTYVHTEKKTSLDLVGFVVDTDSDQTYSGIWSNSIPWAWANIRRWPTLTVEKDITPSGEPIWTLEEPASYLEASFGDWRTPDPYFDGVVADQNLCGFELLTQCHAFARLYESWSQNQPKQAMAYVEYINEHLPDDNLLQDLTAHFQALTNAEDVDATDNANEVPAADH